MRWLNVLTLFLTLVWPAMVWANPAATRASNGRFGVSVPGPKGSTGRVRGVSTRAPRNWSQGQRKRFKESHRFRRMSRPDARSPSPASAAPAAEAKGATVQAAGRSAERNRAPTLSRSGVSLRGPSGLWVSATPPFPGARGQTGSLSAHLGRTDAFSGVRRSPHVRAELLQDARLRYLDRNPLRPLPRTLRLSSWP